VGSLVNLKNIFPVNRANKSFGIDLIFKHFPFNIFCREKIIRKMYPETFCKKSFPATKKIPVKNFPENF